MGTPQVTFVDAGTLVAVLDREADAHRLAAALWQLEFDAGSALLTTDWSLLKAGLAIQARHGVHALAPLLTVVAPALHVEWCSPPDFELAVAAHLAAPADTVDLVDRLEAQVMRRLGVVHRLTWG